MTAGQRPILGGSHPDPSICRVGEEYFLICSTIEWLPAVPIFRSRDLRSWEHIGHVLDRPSQIDLSGGFSRGIFAPTLRHHDGRLWMITTNVDDGRGHLLVHTDDPSGAWSDPVRIGDLGGIDPDLAWLDDRTCLVSFTREGRIRTAAVDVETGAVLGEPTEQWSGTGGAHPEAPHLFRRGDLWYLLIAEGGTERGHAVSIARGRSPFGPWEPCPHNPILTHRGLALGVQNVGHGDLVERPDGTWAMVYLGVRTGGQGRLWSFARETFAQEVEWVDGWPVMGEPIVPATDALTEVDDFTETALGQQWVSPGRWPAELVDLTDRAGWLTLAAADGEPSLVARRQQHLHCTARAWVDASAGTGGLSLRVDPHHHYDVEVGGGRVRAVAAIGPLRSTLADAPLDAHRATLRIDVVRQQRPPWERHGLDEVVLGYEAADGRFTELARLDGRYLAIEVAGALRGRTFALYAADGIVRFDRFTYEGNDARHPISTTQ